jgi:2-haloacid dehalogenase
MGDFDGVRAVLFDAYGTLFRLDSIEMACRVALAPVLGDKPAPADLLALWRAKQIEYSVHRSLMGREHYIDFAAITAEALDYALARFALDLPAGARSLLLRAWQTPTVDPAAGGVLAALSPLPCDILSNGTQGMLEEAATIAGLTAHLSAILSAEEVKVYKPDPRVYALGVERFGFAPGEIAFVSANSWDAAGAGTFGYVVCWVNRVGLPADRHGPPPAAVVRSLAEAAATLRSESSPPVSPAVARHDLG